MFKKNEQFKVKHFYCKRKSAIKIPFLSKIHKNIRTIRGKGPLNYATWWWLRKSKPQGQADFSIEGYSSLISIIDWDQSIILQRLCLSSLQDLGRLLSRCCCRQLLHFGPAVCMDDGCGKLHTSTSGRSSDTSHSHFTLKRNKELG